MASSPPQDSRSCESLASLALPNTTITRAQAVDAGAFMPPAPANGAPAAAAAAQAFRNLPAFCRVAATLKPSSDSDIKIEVWMPASGWNGKFQGVGNGGWAGSISYPALRAAVAAGYATASTDTGHVGNTAAFALDHPEKLVDMGYRAVHEMTVQGQGHRRRLLRQPSDALVLERMFPGRPPGDHRGRSAIPPTTTRSLRARPRSTTWSCTWRASRSTRSCIEAPTAPFRRRNTRWCTTPCWPRATRATASRTA